MRLLRLFFLACSLLVVHGCATEREMSLTDWQLRIGDRSVSITLPARLHEQLAQEPKIFTLASDVPLDPSLRGRDLSLVVIRYHARTTLVIGDERIAPLDVSIFDAHRPSESIAVFRIPGRLTVGPVLPLQLEVADVTSAAEVIPRAPLLVDSPNGGRRIQQIILVNHWTLFGAIMVFTIAFVVCGVMFLLDRRRLADGWFALLAAAMVGWHLTNVGITQALGRHDLWTVPAATTTIVCVATLGFLRAHFALGDRGRYVSLGLAAVGALATALATGSSSQTRAGTAVLNALVFVTIGYEIAVLIGVIRRDRPRRVDAIAITACWLVLLVCVMGNVRSVAVQLVPVAWMIFILVHAVLLVRAHERELSQRITLLEARNRDVAVLNDELRRQIGDRAETLADALMKLGEVPAARARFAPGETIADRYRVVRTLGEGGMGAVHEVERIADEKHFALKVLSGARSGPVLARFAREAQVLAHFDHPNLVGIVDVSIDPVGIFFVVMELVEGKSLADEREKRGDARWARAVLQQIAAGLAELHRHGIVHRDLKPGNILLANGAAGGAPRVKIADFGIARLDARFTTGDDDTVSAHDPTVSSPALTQTGVIMGTPAYMAPELARGTRDAQPSSDVFAFGVIAYELLTGGYPFAQIPLYATTGDSLRRAPLPSTLPEWCAKIVDGCLAEDPPARPTANELARILGLGDASLDAAS